DFYGGNLFVRGERIVGVVDWSGADLVSMEQEVSWAAGEVCQGDAGEDLDDDRAESFFSAYVNAGGPATIAPPFDPLPWIRQRLRAEARGWFSDPRSATEPDVYHQSQLVAFERLRDRRLDGRGCDPRARRPRRRRVLDGSGPGSGLGLSVLELHRGVCPVAERFVLRLAAPAQRLAVP